MNWSARRILLYDVHWASCWWSCFPSLTESLSLCLPGEVCVCWPHGVTEVKMSISSDEVNFLVYRYLQESGILPSLTQSSILHLFAFSSWNIIRAHNWSYLFVNASMSRDTKSYIIIKIEGPNREHLKYERVNLSRCQICQKRCQHDDYQFVLLINRLNTVLGGGGDGVNTSALNGSISGPSVCRAGARMKHALS